MVRILIVFDQCLVKWNQVNPSCRRVATISSTRIPVRPIHPYSPFLTLLQGNQPNDYDTAYPEDEYTKEMSDNARVWRVYLDEAERIDAELVDRWTSTLDTLLIFVRTAYCTNSL